jgi:hypothetical protein
MVLTKNILPKSLLELLKDRSGDVPAKTKGIDSGHFGIYLCL